jgi:hypothetical protein
MAACLVDQFDQAFLFLHCVTFRANTSHPWGHYKTESRRACQRR